MSSPRASFHNPGNAFFKPGQLDILDGSAWFGNLYERLSDRCRPSSRNRYSGLHLRMRLWCEDPYFGLQWLVPEAHPEGRGIGR